MTVEITERLAPYEAPYERDRDKRKEDLAAAFEQLAAHGPPGLGPLVNIDTGQSVPRARLAGVGRPLSKAEMTGPEHLHRLIEGPTGTAGVPPA